MLASDLLCDFKQLTCSLWASVFLWTIKAHVGGKTGVWGGRYLLALPAMMLKPLLEVLLARKMLNGLTETCCL